MATRSLVTGGAGFLGSHLCQSLLERGDEVICLDNLFTSRMETIESLIAHERFSFIEHDVTEPYAVESDVIYNLACPAAPGHYQYDPIYTLKISVLGALHALELAKQTGATVVHASTSEVYGDPKVHPQPEEYRGCVNPIGLRACYDEGKRAAETLMFDYNRMHNVDIRVARIFNTYGPHMHPFDGRVVSNFIRQALAGDAITVFGDGEQSRSFCFVSDLVRGLVRMGECSDAMGPINLGNPKEFTMLELANLVLELTSSDSTLEHMSLPADDPMQRQPIIDRAKAVLDWSPEVELRDGLAETIAWFSSIDVDEWTPPTPNWAGGLSAT